MSKSKKRWSFNETPIDIGRFRIAYRGFNMRPFIRWSPIKIGQTRLYTIGPLGIFVSPAKKKEVSSYDY